jgi:hypothetical protein
MRFEVIMAVKMYVVVFWVVMLKMEAVLSSETLVHTHIQIHRVSKYRKPPGTVSCAGVA